MAKILVVEDEPTQQRLLAAGLRRLGHDPLLAGSVAQGMEVLSATAEVGLVILDRQLPDGDGLKVCRDLKRDPRTRHLPVIVLTTLSEFDQELDTYRSGADLFMPKPVQLAKLEKYLGALLDRIPYRGLGTDKLECGVLTLEPLGRKARVGGCQVDAIPERLFALLYLLASKQGKLVTRKVIVQKLWGSTVRDKEVDVTVSRLRKCLGPRLSGVVRAFRGEGYAVVPDFSLPKD